MIRWEMKNSNMILAKKQQKHQPYYQEKLINANLTGEKILYFDRRQII